MVNGREGAGAEIVLGNFLVSSHYYIVYDTTVELLSRAVMLEIGSRQQSFHLLKHSVALVPPKPKLLLRAT